MYDSYGRVTILAIYCLGNILLEIVQNVYNLLNTMKICLHSNYCFNMAITLEYAKKHHSPLMMGH
jgi:hypothetical protein